MKPVIKIDIVSDVVCPWCYIGKRRLEKAIGLLADEFLFELEYHPFELNPEMPEQGVDQKAYLVNKFGGETKYWQITERTTQVAAEEGLLFHFHKQGISPNTRRIHSLIQAAREEGKQPEVVEAFFKAYFTDGIDLSKEENLVYTAVAAGIQQEKVKNILSDDAEQMAIVFAEEEMYKLGITGVPFYIINNRYGVSGAQPTETFVKALREIGSELTTTEGASCTTAEGFGS
jgi:predicted DsbA family dithiol-disulfide isomerase